MHLVVVAVVHTWSLWQLAHLAVGAVLYAMLLWLSYMLVDCDSYIHLAIHAVIRPFGSS